MLIDEEDRNVFPLLCEPIERLLYGVVVCFGIDDEEVLLCIRRLRDVLGTNVSVLGGQQIHTVRRNRGLSHTPTPARSKPVMESWRRSTSFIRGIASTGAEPTSSPITARKWRSL